MTIQKPLDIILPSPLQRLPSFDSESEQAVNTYCKRDDLIHELISGNKWRKLTGLVPILLDLKRTNKEIKILSFGGAYSNHLHALAYLCFTLNIQLIAIVRGHYEKHLTPTLTDIQKWHAHIHFVDKTEYKLRTDEEYLFRLKTMHGANLIVPEGGSSELSFVGLNSLGKELDEQIDQATHIIMPVASGGTMAGLIDYYVRQEHKPNLIGIAVLKGEGYLEQLVTDLLPSTTNELLKYTPLSWHILHDFHQGGYAKSTLALSQFISDFTSLNKIQLEPVYSGKCFYAVKQLMNNAFFPNGSKIVILHTGGLQGKRRVNV
ncbi:1-aminocyclopropane-1-carboxylate deaminase/D-cysteine desulfhydrase [Glaciecola petra]|uniref:Pyridoxal-phosphate dependent enzyme n=1 Tax=Glaciecola petra TaxID=3075602 RepID=A0ABU2ZN22_9ALTE|nr:pyridoxal-phosphate dependent enzyme [Aestuariibacter sp. P117]MDT0593438.1 pyridoxal-phosphate dependent enzyme [Aestuariibacter sp. P117]